MFNNLVKLDTLFSSLRHPVFGRSLIAIAFLLSLPFAAEAQSLFPGARAGELPNGFRYVLKNNASPAHQISFRLAFTVGSLQEKPGEEGAAHFIEHLAFRHTKRFPNGSLVRHLEALGGKYGITINAYTGYDRTVYLFSVPSHNARMLDLGMKIVEDWLSAILFTEQAVQSEKPVIYEEIREGEAPDCFDNLKRGSDSCLTRLPIASIEQVKRINPCILNRFYRRNYLPHNATLLICGPDVENTATESLIKKTFGKLSGNPALRELPKPLHYCASRNFARCPDPYRGKASIEWIVPLPFRSVSTQKQVIDDKINGFIVSLINNRLRSKKNHGRISRQWYLGATEHLLFELDAETDSLLSAEFRHGIAVLGGICRKGFSEEELARQKNVFIDENRNTTFQRTSEQWCDYYTNIAVIGWRDATCVSENNAILNSVEELSLTDCNAIAANLLKRLSENPLVGYRFNPSQHKELTLCDIRKNFDRGLQHPDISAVSISASHHPPLQSDPSFLKTDFKYSPDLIARSQKYEGLGAEEIHLKNGARIILKPTESADSLVSVVMLFRGGLSEIPEEEYPFLESAASYMSIGGMESIATDVYNETLAEKSLSIVNTMEADWHGIMASGKCDNLSMLAALVHGKCFKPEKCDSLFEEIKEEMKADRREKNRHSAMSDYVHNSPERLMRQQIYELVQGNSLRCTELSEQQIESLNLNDIAEYYRKIFTRSTGLTCLVIGNFDMQEAKEHFVAMLSTFRPAAVALPHCSSASISAPTWKKVANNPQPGRLGFSYLHRGRYGGGLRQTLVLKITRDLLRHRMIEEIRNNAGLIYSPYVDLHYKSIPPDATFAFDINGTINEENLLPVKDKIDHIIRQLQTTLPPADTFNAIKQSFLVTKAEHLSPDASANWKEYLISCIKEGTPLVDADKYQSILESIEPEDILTAFQHIAPTVQRTFLYVGTVPFVEQKIKTNQ